MSDQSNAVARRGAAELRGVVRNVQFRSELRGENGSVQVLTFHLEQHDAVGKELQPTLVELRGVSLEGQVTDGEDVTVTGKWRNGRVVAKQVASRTTGATVGARRPSVWLIIPFVILLLVVLAFIAFVIHGMVTSDF
ncbi:hypothetical protein OHA18_17665 [Kribbella sp. NBC_00709]|uniref:hypothetical protein n=1 Tax=Kribbella sp. NBC_00709 TaxID=2975972 RepID=UPI002E2CC218|nr:hypothetical protein [Kribbella sp. NBC_00709]